MATVFILELVGSMILCIVAVGIMDVHGVVDRWTIEPPVWQLTSEMGNMMEHQLFSPHIAII